MHVVHLGLLFVCNGSGLMLAKIQCAISIVQDNFQFWRGFVAQITLPRNLLLRYGHFGDDAVSNAVKLARAYQQFKSWTHEQKIECSQPPFTEKMVS